MEDVQSNYKCDICEKSFSQKEGLVHHKEIHVNSKYKCEICDKWFDTRYLPGDDRTKDHSGHKYLCLILVRAKVSILLKNGDNRT